MDRPTSTRTSRRLADTMVLRGVARRRRSRRRPTRAPRPQRRDARFYHRSRSRSRYSTVPGPVPRSRYIRNGTCDTVVPVAKAGRRIFIRPHAQARLTKAKGVAPSPLAGGRAQGLPGKFTSRGNAEPYRRRRTRPHRSASLMHSCVARRDIAPRAHAHALRSARPLCPSPVPPAFGL
jgi:hypothetical protein